MQLQFVQELEACHYNEFLMALDDMLTKTSRASAAGMNLLTQLMLGYANQDTSIYLAVAKFQEGLAGNATDWELIGQGFQLALSQMLKVEASESRNNFVYPTTIFSIE